MASLFTDQEKTLFGSYIDDIHDTFSRPIWIWKMREQVVVSESQNHNFIWGNSSAPSNTTTNDIVVSGRFNGRILYGDKQNKDPFASRKNNGAEDQINAELELGEVRIKIDPTGAQFLVGAQRVTFDDDTFQITSSKRPHGLFTTQYYTFYLQKVN